MSGAIRRRGRIFCCVAALCLVQAISAAEAPALFLISLDGFRWDFLETFETPNLDRLASGGVRAESLIGVFPTKTFPNHYSIATGLYPDHHGVVANAMRDPGTGRWFRPSDQASVQNGFWWGGEPVWVTLQRQGGRAGIYFWPGSEAPVQGVRAWQWRAFETGIAPEARMKQLLAWYDALRAQAVPALLAAYFEHVDDAGHDAGPGSEAVARAIAEVDAAIGVLLDGLERRGALERVHVMVVSDHGQSEVHRDRQIVLSEYIDPEAADVAQSGAFLALYPRAATAEAILESLADKHPHLKVYARDSIPPALGYGENPRVAPVIGIPDPGWVVTPDAAWREKGLVVSEHGYDPRHPDMHGIFLARGPRLASGTLVPAFENIHLYSLMCHILEIDPAPNDGSMEPLKAALR